MCCPHLLSVLSMKRSSSSQKCSGIPRDSISAKLSPSTWPTQGWVTDHCVSAEHTKWTFSLTIMLPHTEKASHLFLFFFAKKIIHFFILKWCMCGNKKHWAVYLIKSNTTTGMYSWSWMHYLRLLWRTSLRLIPQSFVFVYRLCGVFCIPGASHSTHSDGKTSVVLAICWSKQILIIYITLFI